MIDVGTKETIFSSMFSNFLYDHDAPVAKN
jgi:hypothetical protein